ncbi:MAG: 30S ribosomal protein S20 [Acidobacteriota bacterium]
MVQHKSALKEWKKSLKRRMVNKTNKSKLKTQIKKFRKAIEEKNIEVAKKLLKPTFSLIDKTVKKGTIHKNTGSRYKSRLQKSFNSLVSTE